MENFIFCAILAQCFYLKEKIQYFFMLHFSQFHPTGLFLYQRQTSKNLLFSDIFRGLERDQWHEMG